MTADSQTPPPAAAAFSAMAVQALAAWHQGMRMVGDAQSEMFERVLSAAPNAEFRELVERWTDAQREMLTGWRALGERAGAAAGLRDLQEAGAGMTQSLRDAAERLVEAQGQWAKAWTEAREDVAPQGPAADR
jgi:hypothetical protein